MAALLIGVETRITSLDDDTHVARTLKAAWAMQRRATIREGAYNFSMRRAELAAQTDHGLPSLYPYASFFRLPAEALRLVEVLNADVRDDYQLEADGILCHSTGPLYVRHNVDVAEPAKWDELFADAFAKRLAWSCGTRLAGSAFSVPDAWQAYLVATAASKRVDARENPPIAMEESSWVSARYGTFSLPVQG